MIPAHSAVIKQLHTLRDFIRYSAAQMHKAGVYFGHGTDNTWDEAAMLVLHTAGLPWDVSAEALAANLLDTEKAEILSLLDRRIDERKPLPYLLGEAWFCGMPFYVDEQVLIPRSPIAQLIAEGFQPWLGDVYPERILDMCTGSGCIGIACASYFDMAQVDLVDLSPTALAVCQRNIERHQLTERVRAVQSDGFSALDQRYPLIVCNPPYVDADDFSSMPAEYRHEPAMALASGEDGLELPRQLLAQACDYLTDDGLLVLEVGNSEVALQQQYPEVPFTWIELPAGGNGVCVITAAQLAHYRHLFVAAVVT